MTSPNLHNPALAQRFQPVTLVGSYHEPLTNWGNSNGPAAPTVPARGIKRNTPSDCTVPRPQECSPVVLRDNLTRTHDSVTSRELRISQDPNWVPNSVPGHECPMRTLPVNNMNQDVVDCGVKNTVSTHVHDVNVNRVQNPNRTDLRSMPWFHGMISRDKAEQLLQPRSNGLFLVRESTNFPGDYTLCVCYQNKVEHYRVKYHDRKLTIDDEEFFDNLALLVEHYQQDADGLCTQLVQWLPKETKQHFEPWKSEPETENCHRDEISLHLEKAFEGCMIQEKELDIREQLGKGEFGEVSLGMWNGKRVAVKMLKDSGEAMQKFLEEAQLMKSLKHENLVNLLGVVYNNKHIYLVTEYMSKGSLVDYLRSRGRLHVTKKDQINFAYDTSAGMEFLEHEKIVHRDLAARNVLIAENGVAKVSDFGLARLEKFAPEAAKLPIKWTAPEALKHNRFSNKSDMWSFGILLWEIYSFGRVPYPRIPLADVVKHVEKGYKMEAPEGCPSEVYEIMRQAWDLNPEKRPTFKLVKAKLEQLKTST
ncbi:C-terminal Src kinase [Carabus blaptoides fortunei]